MKELANIPSGSDSKESGLNAGDRGLIPGLGRSPGEGNGNLSNLAWKIPWMEEPCRYSPRGCKESETTGQLHFHFHFSTYIVHKSTHCIPYI